jgi:hypothetical protein
MKYTVLWRRAAEATLADLWMTAVDRHAIASAADAIDDLLSRKPLELGESREGSSRILFLGPLAAMFTVAVDDRLVHVESIWRIAK